MTTSPSCDAAIPDESEEADRYWQDEGERHMHARCDECAHWHLCTFVHVRDANRILGQPVAEAIEDAWGTCDLDGSLAYGGTREGAEHGNDCWEAW